MIPKVLGFHGQQQIVNIEEAYASLRTALVRSTSVEIDLTAVTEADLAFAQLLVATRKSAVAAGKSLRWRVAADGPIPSILARAGLDGASLLEDIPAKGVSQ